MQRQRYAYALLLGFAPFGAAAVAQSFPARPIRIIVPNTPGSAMDMVARVVGQRLTEQWGQQVVVDDRPGASGIIGHELAAKAPGDGYTLLLAASAGVTINPLLTKVPYDSVRDFAPITLLINSAQVLASHPSLAASSVGELLAVARAKPGQLNCGTPGSGSSNHLACEMLNVLGHVTMMHVPFKGTVPAMTGLLSGQVHIGFASISTTLPQVKAGKLRVLGQGGDKRSPVIPNVPTIAETLPGFQATTWYALYAPRTTPIEIIERLNGAVVKILSDANVVRVLGDQGLDPAPSTPAQLTSYMGAEHERFARIIKLAGLAALQKN